MHLQVVVSGLAGCLGDQRSKIGRVGTRRYMKRHVDRPLGVDMKFKDFDITC